MQQNLRRWLKRLLLWGLIGGLTLALLRVPIPVSVSSAASGEVRGVWLTNVNSGVLFVPWGIQRAIASLAKMQFNTVYPVVWNRGDTFYPSQVAQDTLGRDRQPLYNFMHLGTDAFEQIVQQSHRQGLRVIPWFEYGLMTPKNSTLAKRHPDWLTHNIDNSDVSYEGIAENPPDFWLNRLLESSLGIQQQWLNPFHPEVQEFIKGMIVEVVSRYDVDGIQLDDHFGLPVAMGYDAYTVELYQQEHQGQKPPLNYYNPRWMGWRANKLTEFMGEIYQAVKAVNPDCIVSLSPNSQSYAYQHSLQNWRSWVERGYIDELVLQVYRNQRDRFLQELHQPAVQFAKSRIPVSIGILSGVLSKPVSIEQIQNQVKLA
ncbi:MAG: family 10 glycosylhydrolase, partial [Kamptonema sp. SIO4C4]|nr:family 10 glycosylhydrolase [Kamptonema sp. SIO4C4]